MERILIVAPSWIGDAVMSHALIQRLREKSPDVHIAVTAPAWVLPVYRRMADVTEVIENPFAHGDLRLLDRRAFGKSMAARGFTHAYVLPNTFKSALLTWFAGIPTTAWRGEKRGWIVSDCRDLDETRWPTMAERFAALADPLHVERKPLRTPQLRVDQTAQRATLARLGLAAHQTIVALCPGAEYGPAKRWPVQHAAAYAKARLAEGNAVWLFGGKGDREIAEAIRQQSSDAVQNLCGNTSLEDAIDLLAMADHVITNDSGLMHIACAVGAPVVALYGSSSPAFTPPLSPKARVVSLGVECSPCFKRACPLGHFKCMNDMTAAVVEAERSKPERAAIPAR